MKAIAYRSYLSILVSTDKSVGCFEEDSPTNVDALNCLINNQSQRYSVKIPVNCHRKT